MSQQKIYRNKLSPPLEMNGLYLGFFGWRNYEELFGYSVYFCPAKHAKPDFIFHVYNEKNEDINLSGTIDFYSKHSKKLIFSSSQVNLKIHSCEELEMKLECPKNKIIDGKDYMNNYYIVFSLKEN